MTDPATTLYEHKTSSASWRVRIGLSLKGIPYRSVLIDLRQGDNLKPEYQDLSALQQVPCLFIDGAHLTQTVAILEYLDETRPQPAFLPTTPSLRATAREIVEAINAGTQPLHNLAVLRSLSEELDASSADALEWARRWARRRLEGVERLLRHNSGRFAVGDSITIADLFLYPQIEKVREMGVVTEDLEHVTRVMAALATNSAFTQTSPQALWPSKG